MGIDSLTPILFDSFEILKIVPQAIQDSLKFEAKLTEGKPPLYTYEDMVQRVMQRMGGLDEESSKVLLSRGMCESVPGSGLFHFTHDI